ncbi:MAG: hypothetical protein GTN71_02955 [Anaerolineae bacterium]|nr:hypothetical protein [Anaerolineae bacterium]
MTTRTHDPCSFRIAVQYAECYGISRAYEVARANGASETVCGMLARWRRQHRETGRVGYC